MARRPAALANCSAQIDIPPVPSNDAIPSSDAAFDEQRVPGRDPGAGYGGSFNISEMRRDRDEASSCNNYFFHQRTVPSSP